MRKAIKPFIREFKHRFPKPAFQFKLPEPLQTPASVVSFKEHQTDAVTSAEDMQNVAREGRILPSLIEEPDPLTLRLKEAEQKRKKPGRPRKSKNVEAGGAFSAMGLEWTELKAQAIIRKPRRQRSSIQERWVRKTGLKPGERWKRRIRSLRFIKDRNATS